MVHISDPNCLQISARQMQRKSAENDICKQKGTCGYEEQYEQVGTASLKGIAVEELREEQREYWLMKNGWCSYLPGSISPKLQLYISQTYI